ELAGVLVVMSILMLVTAMMRKRIFLGVTTALFGLAVFNLHYWGFGVPFLMVGSWYLVRAYRLQRGLREAGGGGTYSSGSKAVGRGYSQPGANKRYTPPVARTKRPTATQPKDF
ncbi:MAG TPA: hypothetical protein VG368_05335, partial [Acidimicrobiales bacterium]|nr:hypothetical protein [Acidimicrobiales bacterium]